MRQTLPKKLTTRQRAIKAGYRSGLEEQTAKALKKKKIKFSYELLKIKWEDFKIRTYTPDFQLPNGIIIETKLLSSFFDSIFNIYGFWIKA